MWDTRDALETGYRMFPRSVDIRTSMIYKKRRVGIMARLPKRPRTGRMTRGNIRTFNPSDVSHVFPLTRHRITYLISYEPALVIYLTHLTLE